MPPRRFNGVQLQNARRRAGLKQIELARRLGHSSHVNVTSWENEKRFPPAEKLVAIAGILGEDADALFPRGGPCDLADLRCDAGYTRSAAAEKVAGLSRFALGDAEGGRNKLGHQLISPLADLYGVSPEQLEAAQALSFGAPSLSVAAPDPSFGAPSLSVEDRQPPRLAEKLSRLVTDWFQGGDPSPGEIAAAVNARAGTTITGGQVESLLAGTSAADVFEPGALAVSLTAIAGLFGVSELVLHDDVDVDRRVLADLRYLAARRDVELARRDGKGGVSAAMLGVLDSLIGHAPEF